MLTREGGCRRAFSLRRAELKIFLAGRLAVEYDHRAIDDARFPGRQGRLLFAYLVTEQNRPVPRDELAQVLWADHRPATWEKALSVLVSKLRTLLTEAGVPGTQVLTNAFGCYRLDLPDVWVDVLAATDASRSAERAAAAGDWPAAMSAGELAESVTRNPLLPGESGEWVERKRREFADVRRRAVHALAEAHLGTGDADSAVRRSEDVIALEPFLESGYRLLMRARAAQGNSAEALRVYERCRRLLDEELGAYPSAETNALHQQLLEAEALPAPPPADRSRPPARPVHGRWRSRLLLPAVGAISLAAIVAVAFVVAPDEGGPERAVAPNSVVELGSSGSVLADIPVGIRPGAVAEAAGSLWVANQEDRSLSRVDLRTHRLLHTVPVDGVPLSLASVRDTVWATTSDGRVLRVDPTYDTVDVLATLGPSFTTDTVTPWPMLAVGGAVWVADPDGFLVRLDTGSGRETGRVDVGNEPSTIVPVNGAIWVTNRSDGTVTQVDDATLVTSTFPVGHGPSALAPYADHVWVADTSADTLVRVDPLTTTTGGSVSVGHAPSALLATPEALWLASEADGTLLRLDPGSGSLVRTVRVGGSPTALTVANGHVWVTVAAPPPPVPASGGTVRVTVQGSLPTLDPAVPSSSYTPQLLYATCAELVTYPDEQQPGGSRIVPEIAQSVPTPTDAGRTYTFTIRSGFRFSPPSGQAVTAATVKATFERLAAPALKSPWADVVSEVAGYRAYVAGRAPGLSGIIASADTLTIRLTKPDGGFLAKLAGGAACVVPEATPAVSGGLPYVPSAGPYYVASYTAGRQLVLARNPNYHGERPRRPDRIVLNAGVDEHRALDQIRSGVSDYALDGLSSDDGRRLDVAYGANSGAARQGRQQYFVSPADAVRWLYMNASRPPFADVRLRRAVNYALDRQAVVAQDLRFPQGNPFTGAIPTSDYLSPSVTGAGPLELYPAAGPDLAHAASLSRGTHVSATMYTPNQAPWLQEAQIVRTDLGGIGIDVRIEQFPLGEYFDRLGRPGEPYDLAVVGWQFADSDPVETLGLFEGTQVGQSDNQNYGYFTSTAYDRALHALEALSGPARYRAAVALERELERDSAPVAALAVDSSQDFFSARIGCQVYQPVFGMDLAALCIRP